MNQLALDLVLPSMGLGAGKPLLVTLAQYLALVRWMNWDETCASIRLHQQNKWEIGSQIFIPKFFENRQLKGEGAALAECDFVQTLLYH